MDDPASGHHYYRYTSGRLTEYESPTGAKTTYTYDSNGFLNEIIEPGGTTVELDVLSSGKVNAITTTLPGGVPQTTSFVYTRRTYKSDAIAPDGVRRTYAYDDDWRVTRQYNPDEIPAVSASGELKDLEGGYVGPNRTYPVTVAATQPDGAGLRRLWLTLVPENELAGENVPCTTTPFDLVCPQTYDVPLDIDFAPLPEGPTTVRGAARDDEQNRGNSTAWEVTVDKTAPIDVTPSGELFDLQDGYINGQGTKTLTASALDPDMANGTRLSGIKRFQLEDIGNGTIATTDVACTTLACPVTATETLNVDTTQMAEGAHQLRIVATDLVGNVTRSDPWTVFVDRTGPTAPHSVTTDFDEDEATAHLSWDADDPLLSDGSPGSGIGGYTVSYTVAGATRQTSSEAPSIELEGAQVGDQVTASISGIDAVGNTGATTTQTLTIAALQNCNVAAPVNDPVPLGLLPGTQEEQTDMFVLTAPVTPGALLAALPASARLVSVLDRDPSPTAEHSSGMLIPDGYSAASAMGYWSTTLLGDLSEEEDELIAARDNSTVPAYVAEVDRQLGQIQTRRQRMSAAAGVPVRAFSVVHDSAVAAAITSAFAGNLTTAATVLPTADCEGTPGDPIEDVASAAHSERATRSNEPSLDQPQEVKDYTANSYSPPFIRVRTQIDTPGKRHKVTLAWKYVSVSNLAYWRSKYRRSGTQRGTEIQLDMNQDGDSKVFGLPYWYRSFLDPGPAPAGPIDWSDPTPEVWNANFKCAYPDDYFSDKKSSLSLAIGLACRPNNIYKRYRWAHFITAEDANDRVTVSVNPTHYGKDDHSGGTIPLVGIDLSERWYCNRRGGRLGSCMFSDHGPPQRRYRAPGGSATVTTPSNVVFARRPVG